MCRSRAGSWIQADQGLGIRNSGIPVELCIQMARPERADAGPWPETRPPDIRGRRDHRAPRSVGACAV